MLGISALNSAVNKMKDIFRNLFCSLSYWHINWSLF